MTENKKQFIRLMKLLAYTAVVCIGISVIGSNIGEEPKVEFSDCHCR